MATSLVVEHLDVIETPSSLRRWWRSAGERCAGVRGRRRATTGRPRAASSSSTRGPLAWTQFKGVVQAPRIRNECGVRPRSVSGSFQFGHAICSTSTFKAAIRVPVSQNRRAPRRRVEPICVDDAVHNPRAEANDQEVEDHSLGLSLHSSHQSSSTQRRCRPVSLPSVWRKSTYVFVR